MSRVTTVTVPAWRLRVIDSSGTIPLGACVSESWLQYSFEPGLPHEAKIVLGGSGEVQFPERSVTATRGRRALIPLLRALNVHSGSGGNAFVIVWGRGIRGDVLWSEGEALPRTIVVTHDSNSVSIGPC